MTPKSIARIRAAAAAVALTLAFATSAFAQVAGLFYAEEKKDNRIYVFNVKANWERFVAAGETGTGLTRIGVGPNGETVFADNETALELFFFKYNIKEEVKRPPVPVQSIVWRDGKTRITMGNAAYLEMSNRIQPRFTYEMPDSAARLPGTGDPGDSRGSFTIRRAKFKLEGWFYKPELEFELQLNWPDASVAQPNRFVEDANIDWDISKKKAFRLRFGQFKAAYGRQQITSSGAQQFVDRAQTDGRYNPARETGIALWGTLGGNKLDWRLMASNGNARSQATNDNDKYLWTARVMWQPNGATRMNQWASGLLLTEGDIGDSTDKPLYAFAANFASNDLSNVSATLPSNLKNTQYGGDYIFKYKGFSSVGEYTYRKSKPQITNPEFKDKGYVLQASYAFKTKALGATSYLELAARYSEIDPSNLAGADKRKEAGGALSYYYNKHNLKVQVDYRNLKVEGSARTASSDEFRLQTQFIF